MCRLFRHYCGAVLGWRGAVRRYHAAHDCLTQSARALFAALFFLAHHKTSVCGQGRLKSEPPKPLFARHLTWQRFVASLVGACMMPVL